MQFRQIVYPQVNFLPNKRYKYTNSFTTRKEVTATLREVPVSAMTPAFVVHDSRTYEIKRFENTLFRIYTRGDGPGGANTPMASLPIKADELVHILEDEKPSFPVYGYLDENDKFNVQPATNDLAMLNSIVKFDPARSVIKSIEGIHDDYVMTDIVMDSDGIIWRKTNEPCYRINTFSGNYMATCITLDTHYEGQRYNQYNGGKFVFNALQYDEAVEQAVEIAKFRGDLASIPHIQDDTCNIIDVLDPNAVTFDAQLEIAYAEYESAKIVLENVRKNLADIKARYDQTVEALAERKKNSWIRKEYTQ